MAGTDRKTSVKHVDRVAADHRRGLRQRHVDGLLEPGDRLDRLRDAGGEPRADVRVGQRKRLDVDPDPLHHRRHPLGNERRRRPQHLRLDRDRRTAGAGALHRRGGTDEPICVPVEVQGKSGAGSDVDERHRPPVGELRIEREDKPGAPSHLVHLIAMCRHCREQLVAVIEAEPPVLDAERVAERRLPLPHVRKPATERLGFVGQHQMRRSGREQQRRQTVRWGAGGERPQLGVVSECAELCGDQPPRVRRVRS